MFFTTARINYIANDMMLSRYLLNQSRSSFIRYVRFGAESMKTADLLPLLESMIKDRYNRKKLMVSHLNSEEIHATRASLAVLLVKAAGS